MNKIYILYILYLTLKIPYYIKKSAPLGAQGPHIKCFSACTTRWYPLHVPSKIKSYVMHKTQDQWYLQFKCPIFLKSAPPLAHTDSARSPNKSQTKLQ